MYSTSKNKKYTTPINYGSAKTTLINDLQEHPVTSTYRYIECDSNIDEVITDIHHDYSKKLNKTHAYEPTIEIIDSIDNVITEIDSEDDDEDKDPTCNTYFIEHDPENDIEEQETTCNKHIITNFDKANFNSKEKKEKRKIINVDKHYN